MVKAAFEKLITLDFSGAKTALGESVAHSQAVISEAMSPYVEPVMPYVEPLRPYAIQVWKYWEELSWDVVILTGIIGFFCFFWFTWYVEYYLTGKSLIREVKETMGLVKGRRKKQSAREIVQNMTDEERARLRNRQRK
eukprot:Nk52_evm1s2579 gene=Nk52_evmTU1s2579